MQAELEPPFVERGFGPYLGPEHSYGEISDRVEGFVLHRRPSLAFWVALAIAFALAMVLLLTITLILAIGVGLWGVMIPVAWGFAITSFVWWIGIGHAGTLISAILLLL